MEQNFYKSRRIKSEIDTKMMDKLDLLFQMQQKFQNKYGFKMVGLDKLASAIMAEGGELWKIGEGKWWSKKTYPRSEKVEELVDILHFFLIACLELGVTSQELLDEYSKKLAENYKRQIRGY